MPSDRPHLAVHQGPVLPPPSTQRPHSHRATAGAPRPNPTSPIPLLFIGGVGRSGSTLVERWLGERCSLAAPGELDSLWEQGVLSDEHCGCQQPFSRCDFWTEVGRHAFGGWDAHLARAVALTQRRVLRLRHLPWRAMGPHSARATTSLCWLRDVSVQLISSTHVISGREGVVDSSKRLTRYLMLAEDPRLDCALLHLVREPDAVIRSWSTPKLRPHSRPEPTYLARRGLWSVSLEWLLVNGCYHHFASTRKGSVTTCFADFLRDPEILSAQLSHLFPHAQLPHLPAMDGRLHLSVAHGMGGNSARFDSGTVSLRPDLAGRSSSTDVRVPRLLLRLLRLAYSRVHDRRAAPPSPGNSQRPAITCPDAPTRDR